MAGASLIAHTASVRVEVRVIPRSRRDEVDGIRGDRLLVRTTKAPVDGKANQAVRRLLAEHFGVTVSKVEIVAGHQSRDKTVEIAGETNP
jgi:uncharacterized protein (TIGR00251 family)